MTATRATRSHSSADPFVRARVEPTLKSQAAKILQEKDVTLSDLLRETLVRVVRQGDVPFPVRTRTGVVDPGVREELTRMHLPELHQARWAEVLAQLRDEKRNATRPAEIEAIEARIREHYTHRHDIDQTKRALLKDAPEQKIKPPRARG